ncbi:MAG: thermonuclease family protein [Syntrophobacteraceae bacterium]
MVWKRDLQSVLFWGCIAVLLGASLFYGLNAESMRRSMFRNEGKVDSGNIVTLSNVIDGDTVRVVQEGQQPVSIRILGIKAFEASIAKDVVAPYGQAAVDTLQRMMGNKPVRVLLHSTPKDRYGRYIATLYVDDQDIGLRLVKEGLAMVYTVYPFPAMSLYLQEQELARAGRRGLWANAEVASRALGLIREWQGHSQQ